MKIRNLKLLGLWLALALLAACFFGSAALAEDAPAFTLTVRDGGYNDIEILEDDSVNGHSFYRVYIDVEDSEAIDFTMDVDDAGNPVDWMTIPMDDEDELGHDDLGAFKGFDPFGEDGLLPTEIAYFRLPGDDATIRRLVLNYEISEASVTLTNEQTELPVMEPFTLSWDIQSVAEGQNVEYDVLWSTPAGRELVFNTADNTLEFNDGLQNPWGEEYTLAELTGIPGQYRVHVIPYVEGMPGAYGFGDFTFSVPEPDGRIEFHTDLEPDEQGNRSILLHGDFDFTVYAPGADDNRYEIYFGNGDMWERNLNEDEDSDEYGSDEGGYSYHDERLPEFDEGEPHRYNVYARAQFDGEWVYSNSCDFLVYMDSEIQGELTYRVLNPEVARDGLVQIEVDPIEGVNYYEAFIEGEDRWIAKTDWVDANPDDVTLLSMPVAACEPGEYEVQVYATKLGARNLYCEEGTRITVGEAQSDSSFIFSMKDEFETLERLNLYVYYRYPDMPDDVWMDVNFYPVDGDSDDYWYEESTGPEDGYFEFVDHGMNVDKAGDYTLEAIVWHNTGEEEPEQVARGTFDFTVTAPNGDLALEVPELPAYVTLDEGLTYTVAMPKGADYMDTRVHVRGWGGGDFLIESETERDDLNALLSPEVLAEREVAVGDVLEISAYANGYGYNCADWEVLIPVIDTPSDEVSLALEDESLLDEDGVVNLLVHQDLDLILTSADGRPIRDAYFFDGNREEWGNKDWDDEDRVRMWTDFDEGGEYTIYARATFDDVPEDFDWENNEDPREWLTTNLFVIRVPEPVGEVGEFTISSDVDTAERMQDVEITFTEAENAKGWDLWIDPVDENGEEMEFDFDRRWDWKGEEGGVAVLHTATMPVGRYRLVGYASAPGYRGFATEDIDNVIYLNVTEPELPESGVKFTVSKTELDTKEDFTLSAYAPGAQSIQVFYQFRDNPDWQDGWGGESFSDSHNYDRVGEYDLVARAWYDDDNYVDSDPVVVTVTASKGKLEFGEVDLPSSLVLGEDGLDILIDMPEHAEGMQVWIDVDDWDHRLIDEWQEDGEAFERSFSSEELEEYDLRHGIMMYVHAYAWGRGYDSADMVEKRIVILPPADEGVELIAETENLSELLIDVDNIAFKVVGTGDAAPAVVRFFNGNGWWDGGELIDREYDGGNYWDEEDHCFRFYSGMGDLGKKSYYAEVQLEGSDEWITTNTIHATYNSYGTTGEYGFADTNPVYVPRGENAFFTLTASENATDYWADAFRKDESYNPNTTFKLTGDGAEVTLSTANLPEGEYEVRGRAQAPGYELTESTNSVTLVVTDYEGFGITLTVDKTDLMSNEGTFVSLLAPGAERVVIATDGSILDENGWEGDNWTGNVDFGNETGKHTITPYAWFEGNEEWTEGDTVTVNVTAPNGKINLDTSNVPTSIEAGETISFTVPWPEIATYLDYHWNPVGENETRYNSENSYGSDLEVNIDTDEFQEGDVIYIGIWTGGVGYEHNHYNFNIPVVAESGEGVSLEIYGLDDGRYLIGQNYDVTIHAPGADAVKFFDGSSFQEGDDGSIELVPDENGDVGRGTSFWQSGKYTLYAMARFEGQWVSSEKMEIDVESNGPAPAYDVSVPEFVWAGQEALITVADPGENWYWVGVEPRNGGGIVFEYQYDPEEGGEITVPADALEAGKTYVVYVNFAGNGYDGNNKQYSFKVLEAPSVKLTAAKRLYHYGDTVNFTITAPMASEVKLYKGEEELAGIEQWVADEVSEAITFTAEAYFEGLEDPLTANVTIEVRDLGPTLIPTVKAENVHEGQPVTVKVSDVPENSSYKLYIIGSDEVLEGDSDQEFTLEGLEAAGYQVNIEIQTAGYSDNSAENVCSFAVEAHAPVDVEKVDATCTEKGYTAGTMCSICGEYLTGHEEIEALGHSWGAATYEWSTDNSSVTARRVCENDEAHVETETVSATAAVTKPATCAAAGVRTLTATFTNAAFAPQTREEAIATDAAAHSYGQPVYTWSADNKSVMATMTCANDASHVITETVNTTAAVTKPATCAVTGVRTLTATFTNAAFTTQTKEETIALTAHSYGQPVYTWSADNKSVTATITCANDASHVITETVNTTSAVTKQPTYTEKGETTYTASFNNAAFATQTKVVADIALLTPAPTTPAPTTPAPATPTPVVTVAPTATPVVTVAPTVTPKPTATPEPDYFFHMKKSTKKTIDKGGKLQLVIDTKSPATKYATADKKIATISKTGLIKAKKVGKVKITVTLKNKNKLTLTLTVVDPKVPTKVQIAKDGKVIKKLTVKKGKSVNLSAILTPDTAVSKLTWKSSKTSIATISSKGVLKAKKAGKTKITVTTKTGKKTASITVTVK